MQTDTPLVADTSELSLAKHMVFGALSGIVGWAVVTLLMVRLGWPDESWGFALTLSGFAGLWVGPFFGSASGVAVHQLRADAAEKAAHAPVASTTTKDVLAPLAPVH